MYFLIVLSVFYIKYSAIELSYIMHKNLIFQMSYIMSFLKVSFYSLTQCSFFFPKISLLNCEPDIFFWNACFLLLAPLYTYALSHVCPNAC